MVIRNGSTIYWTTPISSKLNTNFGKYLITKLKKSTQKKQKITPNRVSSAKFECKD